MIAERYARAFSASEVLRNVEGINASSIRGLLGAVPAFVPAYRFCISPEKVASDSTAWTAWTDVLVTFLEPWTCVQCVDEMHAPAPAFSAPTR